MTAGGNAAIGIVDHAISVRRNSPALPDDRTDAVHLVVVVMVAGSSTFVPGASPSGPARRAAEAETQLSDYS